MRSDKNPHCKTSRKDAGQENDRQVVDGVSVPQAPRPGALEQQIRDLLRKKQYSLKTEQSYIGWYRRYVRFHNRRHPREMGALEAGAFLTHLAVNRGVAAATQNQALYALVFLYREVLGIDLESIERERARRAPRLPNVLTREEVAVLPGATAGGGGGVWSAAALMNQGPTFTVTRMSR